MEIDFLRFILLDQKYGIRLGASEHAVHSMQCWRGHLLYATGTTLHAARIDSHTLTTGPPSLPIIASFDNERTICGVVVVGNAVTVWDEEGMQTIDCVQFVKNAKNITQNDSGRVRVPEGLKRVSKRLILTKSCQVYERVGMFKVQHQSDIIDIDDEFVLDGEGVWQVVNGDGLRLVHTCALPGFTPTSLFCLNGEKRLFAVGFMNEKEYNLVVCFVDPKSGSPTTFNLGNVTSAFVDNSGHYSVQYFPHYGDQLQDLLVIGHSSSIRLGLAGYYNSHWTTLEITRDEYTADMPISQDLDDTFPLALALDTHTTYTYKVPDDRTEVLEYPPYPVVLVRTSDHRLVSFALVNVNHLEQLTFVEPLAGDAVMLTPDIIPGYLASSSSSDVGMGATEDDVERKELDQPSTTEIDSAVTEAATTKIEEAAIVVSEVEKEKSSEKPIETAETTTDLDTVTLITEPQIAKSTGKPIETTKPETTVDTVTLITEPENGKSTEKPIETTKPETTVDTVTLITEPENGKSTEKPIETTKPFDFKFDTLNKTSSTDELNSKPFDSALDTVLKPESVIEAKPKEQSKSESPFASLFGNFTAPKPSSASPFKVDSSKPTTEPVKILDIEPVKMEPTKPEPVKREPTKPEPVKPETIKVEPVKSEQIKIAPVKPEPVKMAQKPPVEVVNISPKQNTILKAFLDMHQQHHQNMNKVKEAVGVLSERVSECNSVDLPSIKQLIEQKEEQRQRLLNSFDQLQRISVRLQRVRTAMRHQQDLDISDNLKNLEETVERLVAHYSYCKAVIKESDLDTKMIQKLLLNAKERSSQSLSALNECMSALSIDSIPVSQSTTAKWSELKKVLGRRRVELRSIEPSSTAASRPTVQQSNLERMQKILPLPRVSTRQAVETMVSVENATPPPIMPLNSTVKPVGPSVQTRPSETVQLKPVEPNKQTVQVKPQTVQKQEKTEPPSFGSLSFGSAPAPSTTTSNPFSLPPVQSKPVDSPLTSPLTTPSRPSLPQTTSLFPQAPPQDNTTEFKFGQSSVFTPIVPPTAPSGTGSGFAAFASSGGFAAFAGPSGNVFNNQQQQSQPGQNQEKPKLPSSFTQFRG